jgi:hypothetical protein
LSGAGGTAQGALLIEVATYVNQLTRPIKHKAAYDVHTPAGVEVRNFHTRQPSLLNQLRRLLYPSAEDECTDAYLNKVYESRPPLNPEPFACLLRIAGSAEGWLLALHINLRATVEGNLSALVGEAGSLDVTRLVYLAADVRSWHTWARQVTEWETPVWQPYAPCPVCGRRQGLRVNLDKRTAVCTLCAAFWTPATLESLADHVKRVGDGPGVAV